MTLTENINPKAVRPLVLDTEQGAVIVAFHKQTPLPLDDCFYICCKPPFHTEPISIASLSVTSWHQSSTQEPHSRWG